MESEQLSDEDICALLMHHFSIDGHAAFAEEARPAAGANGCMKSSGKQPASKHAAVSLEDFVARTLPLLDMEHEAEKAQVSSLAALHAPCDG
jgi:hypothetical protein